jgi:hypothetical protein
MAGLDPAIHDFKRKGRPNDEKGAPLLDAAFVARLRLCQQCPADPVTSTAYDRFMARQPPWPFENLVAANVALEIVFRRRQFTYFAVAGIHRLRKATLSHFAVKRDVVVLIRVMKFDAVVNLAISGWASWYR